MTGVEIKLPELADGVESADILEVLVKAGDSVQKNQPVVEIETDKATAEIPSPRAGKVSQIHVAAGQTVKVGATLITVDADTAAETPEPTSKPGPSRAQQKKTTKDEVHSDVPRTNISAKEPKTSDAPSTRSTKPSQVDKDHRDGEDDSAEIDKTPAATAKSKAKADAKTTSGESMDPARATSRAVPSTENQAELPIAAGPAIRRFAREVGVDLSTIQGTGEGGRITREDVLDMVRRANRTASLLAEELGAADSIDVPGKRSQDDWGPVSIEAASRMRRTIAAKMHDSWTTVPRVTNFDDADVTELEKIRQSSKADYAARGLQLTSMPFLIKAVSMALRSHPLVNSSYDMDQGQIVYRRYVSIGVAMDTERGLVVPVLRNVDHMSISEIAKELSKTIEKVREGGFSVDDLRGGTFSISNLGAIGGTYSTPIVNTPEVAILLVGRSREMPVVVDHKMVIRLMMPLSLSYDHRIIDGATAARFLNDVIAYLEEPGRLLLAP